MAAMALREPTKEEVNKITHAVCHNKVHTLQKFISNGVNIIGILYEDQFTPLHIASHNGHSSTVEILIKAGANINAVEKDQYTPLHIASHYGHSSTVEILIKAGANINAAEKYQWTPLHIASNNGHSSMVEILIKAGANINAVEKNQWTPLHIASQDGHSSTAEILIKAGANVTAVSKNQRTSLHVASQNGHTSTVEALINAGADVKAVDKRQWTPLHFASQNGHSSTVETLIKAGSDTDAAEENQWTSLHIALQNGHSSTAEILIKAGADLKAVNKDQFTPLHIASQNGHISTVETLIKAGADVNAVEKHQQTPLHIASKMGHILIVETLSKAGSDLNAVDKFNHTVLEYAVQGNHSEIVHYLVNKLKMDYTQFDQKTQQKINELLKEAEKTKLSKEAKDEQVKEAENKQNSSDEQADSPDIQQESVKNMLAKLEQAKANNEILKVSYTTVLFSGSSGVGKTTLLNKLNEENLNRHHHSTGVAKSKHTICIKTTAIVKSAGGLQWTSLDYDSMINHLNKHLHSLTVPTSASEVNALSNLKNRLQNFVGRLFKSSPTSLPVPKDNTRRETSDFKNNKKFKVGVENMKTDLVAVDIAKADSSKTPSLGDVWDIINFLDTGGQPEFVNILPAVSSSVALTFIVFNLNKSLDSLVHVQHSVNGDPSFKPYYLDCTNLEFIKHLMVSSENFNKNNTALLRLSSFCREDCQNDSKICYVGTHALDVGKEVIQEIDDRLSSIATEVELHQQSFWCSPKQHLNRLFPVDMFPVDKGKEKEFESIIKDIRDNIHNQVKRRDYYEVPILWFIFLLNLQKLCTTNYASYLSYQEAVDVWDENVSKKTKSNQDSYKNRENSDVHNVLLFFHFMGMLFYYHKVEGLCDFVFIDRQWLFEKLSELVEIKFTKVYNRNDISAEDVEQFTMEGRLNINIINNLKIDLQGIKPLYFIHLLDYLNIIAPIDLKLNDYFMPSVLPGFPLESAEKFSELNTFYGTIQQEPLLVGFKNGPMHHGFFCHLIVELFRNLPKDWGFPSRPTSKMQHVYNNLITFPTKSGHAVTLFYKIGYLEIQVRHNKQSQPIFIHYNVRCGLDKALRKVSDHLQLNKKLLCYGFYCSCAKIKHFIKLEEPTEYIRCDYSIYTKLTENHRVWLQDFKHYKIKSNPQTTPTEKDDKIPEISELHRSIVPKYAARWKDLGIQLKIDENHLDIIAVDNQNHPSHSQQCCKAMLRKWMEINPGATWNMLQKAINNLPK